MYAEDAIEILGLYPGFLKRWEKTPDKALRIFKLAVKKAYRLRALETHPDRPQGSAEEFKKVGEAYETLQKADVPFILDLIASLPSSQPRVKKRIRKIYVERRGGSKLKLTYISPCGISTSFINCAYDPGWAKEHRKQWTEILVKAMKAGGLMPSYEAVDLSSSSTWTTSEIEYRIVEV